VRALVFLYFRNVLTSMVFLNRYIISVENIYLVMTGGIIKMGILPEDKELKYL
jgi:hypothetical protein